MNKKNIILVILLFIIIIFLFVWGIQYFINSKEKSIPTPSAPAPIQPTPPAPTPTQPAPILPASVPAPPTPAQPASVPAPPTPAQPASVPAPPTPAQPASVPTPATSTMASTINNAINSTLKIFQSKINKIELSIQGQTGKEEYTIESLTGDILVSKRIAPKLGEVISFDTNLPSIVINRFRTSGELYLLKIEKNKQVLPQTRTSSAIRGDLQLFTSITDLNGRILRQQDVNQGKLKWAPTKYQIDIGL